MSLPHQNSFSLLDDSLNGTKDSLPYPQKKKKKKHRRRANSIAANSDTDTISASSTPASSTATTPTSSTCVPTSSQFISFQPSRLIDASAAAELPIFPTNTASPQQENSFSPPLLTTSISELAPFHSTLDSSDIDNDHENALLTNNNKSHQELLSEERVDKGRTSSNVAAAIEQPQTARRYVEISDRLSIGTNKMSGIASSRPTTLHTTTSMGRSAMHSLTEEVPAGQYTNNGVGVSPMPLTASAAAQQQQQTTPGMNSYTNDDGNSQDGGFWSYINAELYSNNITTSSDINNNSNSTGVKTIWGQTERDRVYNAILFVPYQLERFLLVGIAVCLDSFLGILTLLPIRFLRAVRSISSGRSTTTDRARLKGDELFDILSMFMFTVVVFFLYKVDVGAVYFWMKDMTQEFLKLSVLYTALDLGDKICCSFGVDALEALSASCTQATEAPRWWSVRIIGILASDTLVASVLLVGHAAVLMAQAMVFGVAMNSKKNTLIALLIAANFAEIKGTVLKRFDSTRLYILACQDTVERFHLIAVLLFVIVEEMTSSGHSFVNQRLLMQCFYVFMSEVVIDVVKHAVLGKFNEVRPGVYREFMKDLSENVAASHSHNSHKIVGLEPFAPAALFLRVAGTYGASRIAAGSSGSGSTGGWDSSWWTVLQLLWHGALFWCVLAMLKIVLGYGLKKIAVGYMRRYKQRYGKGAGGTGMTIRRAGASITAGTEIASGAGGKKEN